MDVITISTLNFEWEYGMRFCFKVPLFLHMGKWGALGVKFNIYCMHFLHSSIVISKPQLKISVIRCEILHSVSHFLFPNAVSKPR